jgi:hypothetical protein
MKTVNAKVIPVRVSQCHQRKSKLQLGCAALIGLTKSVHPYCRLAIMTMQMTQDTNWVQRVDSDARARASIDGAIVVISIPPLAMDFITGACLPAAIKL